MLNIEQSLPGLARSMLSERDFYLLDPLGRESRIALDFIISWTALIAVLEVRFKGMPGLKKVLKKEYAIQNRATGKDVDPSHHWEAAFLPGLWYYMDMIFQEVQDEGLDDLVGDTCPRCQSKSDQPQGS